MGSGAARRLGWLAALAAVGAAVLPLAASAAPRAKSAAAAGAVYGGLTSQDFAVIVEMNKSRRRVVRTILALRFTCTSGGVFTLADRYNDLKVSKKGRFSSSFSDTRRNDDGTTTDFSGSVSGVVNKARTKVTGKWTEKIIDHDQAGAVTDTCDAGSVSWTAKQ
jgi:hypothetical protein